MLHPISSGLMKVSLIDRLLKRLIPVANYEGILPFSRNQHSELAILDIFDYSIMAGGGWFAGDRGR